LVIVNALVGGEETLHDELWLVGVVASGCFGGYSERPARIGFLFVSYRAGGSDRWQQTRFVVASGRTRIGLDTSGGASTAATVYT